MIQHKLVENIKLTHDHYLAAAGVTVDDFRAELDIPIPGIEAVQPWIPKLNVGGDSEGHNVALQVSYDC